MQTTAIDQEAGLIRLTTVLAHASGEWVSSEWPVCLLNETAAPHRMGAALTYARRYALFTLVGIAGEDDLDAPDLPITPAEDGRAGPAAAGACAPMPLPGSDRKAGLSKSKPVLAPADSATLRVQLEAEIVGLADEDALLAWAQRRLPAKNTLTAEDARTVEQGFVAKLRALETSDQSRHSAEEDTPETGPDPVVMAEPAAESDHTGPVLANGKPRRRRDKDHLAFVAAQPCSGVRPAARGRPSPALCAAAGAGPEGQRRICGSALPATSSRPARPG